MYIVYSKLSLIQTHLIKPSLNPTSEIMMFYGRQQQQQQRITIYGAPTSTLANYKKEEVLKLW